jgi:hypothetical protein
MSVSVAIRSITNPEDVVYVQDVTTCRKLYELAYELFGCQPLRLVYAGARVPCTDAPVRTVIPSAAVTVVHAIFTTPDRATYPPPQTG